MKIDTSKEPELITANTQIKITIPWDSAKKTYAKILRKLATQVKAEGFRKGKVPTHIAENIIGKINIIDHTLQELLPALYTAQVKKLNKQPLTYPDIKPVKIELDADWELIAEIAEKPEFKLGDYKKIAKKAFGEAQKEIKAEKTAPEKKKQENIRLSHIFKALVQKVKPPIPELLLREKVKEELHRLEHDLKHINTTLDDYLKKQNTTFEKFSQQMAVVHLGQAQLEFILRDITVAEKLEATPIEIEARIQKIIAQLKLAQTPENKETEKNFDKAKYTPYITSAINREKVTHFLLNIR